MTPSLPCKQIGDLGIDCCRSWPSALQELLPAGAAAFEGKHITSAQHADSHSLEQAQRAAGMATPRGCRMAAQEGHRKELEAVQRQYIQAADAARRCRQRLEALQVQHAEERKARDQELQRAKQAVLQQQEQHAADQQLLKECMERLQQAAEDAQRYKQLCQRSHKEAHYELLNPQDHQQQQQQQQQPPPKPACTAEHKLPHEQQASTAADADSTKVAGEAAEQRKLICRLRARLDQLTREHRVLHLQLRQRGDQIPAGKGRPSPGLGETHREGRAPGGGGPPEGIGREGAAVPSEQQAKQVQVRRCGHERRTRTCMCVPCTPGTGRSCALTVCS